MTTMLKVRKNMSLNPVNRNSVRKLRKIRKTLSMNTYLFP